MACVAGCSPSKQAIANRAIERVEQFRETKGRLPRSLAELGMAEDESGPVYYCKSAESEYIVWYGTTLGESNIYSSRTKQWKEASGGTCLDD